MSMDTGGKGVVLIAITGGMGSGKSTVSRFWADFMHLPRIDIDEVCRQLLAREMPGWHALRSQLPATFFTAAGDLDRGRLRAALFADAELRRQVNNLIHPLARDRMVDMTGQMNGAMVLVDVPLLYEAGWQDRFDHCVVVYAERAVCCRRLVARDRIAPEEALRSMAAQMALADKTLLAGHVIDNSGCWLFARLQVAHLGRLLGSAMALG
ncbi:MAG: dephospho-CoA kinase [Desulfobulbaceae bacterium]